MPIYSKIQSPCIHVCTKDENNICLGCYRSLDEIRAWYKLSDEEKLNVIEKAESRRSEYDKILPYI